jgi:hypothetical protein
MTRLEAGSSYLRNDPSLESGLLIERSSAARLPTLTFASPPQPDQHERVQTLIALPNFPFITPISVTQEWLFSVQLGEDPIHQHEPMSHRGLFGRQRSEQSRRCVWKGGTG